MELLKWKVFARIYPFRQRKRRKSYGIQFYGIHLVLFARGDGAVFPLLSVGEKDQSYKKLPASDQQSDLLRMGRAGIYRSDARIHCVQLPHGSMDGEKAVQMAACGGGSRQSRMSRSVQVPPLFPDEPRRDPSYPAL